MFLKLALAVTLALIIVNLIYLNYQLTTRRSLPSAIPTATPIIPTLVPTILPTPTLVPTSSPPRVIVPKTNRVSYLPISSGGSTTSNNWANITGTQFTFDPLDYPGLFEITFEANGKLFNGNGRAFFRLYDSTHGTGVDGSEISTTLQSDTLLTSGKLNFFSGKNTFFVQAKSLTADTAIFNSGKLKIITRD